MKQYDLFYYYFLLILLTLNAIDILAQTSDNRVIDSRSGIEIVFEIDADMFPYTWNNAPVNASVSPLDEQEIERSAKVVLDALSKYPVQLLKKNLNRVYVLKKLEFYGHSFGGTNSKDRVFLSNRGIQFGYTNLYLEQLFHAEFSSILLRNYSHLFQENQWRAANSRDIQYGNSGVTALKNKKTSEKFDTLLNQKGILNEYALSKLENDFNAFAKNIFKSKIQFWNLCAAHRRLEKKLELIVAFYGQLDGAFTLEYFKEKSVL